MTKYIISRVNTDSEWDFADFILIEYSTKFKEKIEGLKALWEVNTSTEYVAANYIGCYYDNIECFRDLEELTDMGINIPEQVIINPNQETDGYDVIELTDEQYNSLTRIEQKTGLSSWEIDNYNFTVKTFGKHTGEEYWCNLPLDFMSLFK